MNQIKSYIDIIEEKYTKSTSPCLYNSLLIKHNKTKEQNIQIPFNEKIYMNYISSLSKLEFFNLKYIVANTLFLIFSKGGRRYFSNKQPFIFLDNNRYFYNYLLKFNSALYLYTIALSKTLIIFNFLSFFTYLIMKRLSIPNEEIEIICGFD